MMDLGHIAGGYKYRQCEILWAIVQYNLYNPDYYQQEYPYELEEKGMWST